MNAVMRIIVSAAVGVVIVGFLASCSSNRPPHLTKIKMSPAIVETVDHQSEFQLVPKVDPVPPAGQTELAESIFGPSVYPGAKYWGLILVYAYC